MSTAGIPKKLVDRILEEERTKIEQKYQERAKKNRGIQEEIGALRKEKDECERDLYFTEIDLRDNTFSHESFIRRTIEKGRLKGRLCSIPCEIENKQRELDEDKAAYSGEYRDKLRTLSEPAQIAQMVADYYQQLPVEHNQRFPVKRGDFGKRTPNELRFLFRGNGLDRIGDCLLLFRRFQ